MKKIFILLMTVVCIATGISVFADEPTPITDCTTITVPGSYVLSNDIATTGSCMIIATSSVTLDGGGYNIQGSGAWENYTTAITATSVESVTIRNIGLNGFGTEIYFHTVGTSTITDVDLGNTLAYGIHFENSEGVTISNNTATTTYNTGYHVNGGSVLYLENSSNNTITGNNFSDNSYANVLLTGNTDNITITGNTFVEANYGVYANGCVDLCESRITNLQISDNTITGANWSGVYFERVSDSNVSDNEITDSDVGVRIDTISLGNTVDGNTFGNTAMGVNIQDNSEENEITNNTFNSGNTAVYIESESHNNIVDNNTMTSFASAFYIDNADNNEITNNNITISNINYGDGSSSPLVFTWNGEKYDYYADVGRGIPRNMIGTDYVGIPKGQLVPKDGEYSMKIAEEYNEIVYYDDLSLMTFDHAPGYEVVTSLQRNKEGQFFTISDTPSNPLLSCTDMYGNDCLDQLKESGDNKWSYRDESNLNYWIMDFGAIEDSTRIQLVIEAARDYSLTSDPLKLIQVKDAQGNWVNAYSGSSISSPAGAPRRQVIDLTGKFPTSDHHVKFGYDRTQVDYVAIDTSHPVSYTQHTYKPTRADLAFHGYTAIDKTNFWDHDYSQVYPVPEEPFAPQTGNFTKYGDVRPLLEATDDQFVVMHHGDQMDIAFDYVPPAPGTERSIVLFNWATFKHADMGPVGATVKPLPFNGMTAYPYVAPETYPETEENLAYLTEWNTRVITDDQLGMSLPSSVNTLVEGNTIINNAESEYIGQKGIYIVDETDSIIRNNIIEGFYNGIYSENSTGVQILSNQISRTIGDVISLYNVTNFTVSENSIADTLDVGDGVQIVNSNNVTVSNNNINNVTDDGVFFESSRLISITGNTINGVGDDAIDAENSGDYTVDNNTTSASDSSFEIDGDYIDPSGGEDEVFTERGLSSGWQERTVDLSSYRGQRIMLSFGFYTDGSVLGADVISHVDGDGPEDAGVYVDDITVNSDGSPLFTDNVESGEGEWNIPSVSGDVWAVVDVGAYNESNIGFPGAHSGTHAWHPQYENNGDNTTFQREIDLTSANSSANLVFYTWYNTESCCDAIFVKVVTLSDPTEDSKEITNNVMFSSSTALDLDEVTNLTVLGNSFHADSWVINNESSNLFSDADSGNSWYLFDNTPSWNIYDIKDSNKNGYADEGKDLPFNQTVLGVERWSGLGFDAHPATENKASSKKKHSGSVTRQIKNLAGTTNTSKIEEVKQTFPNAFNNQGVQGNGGTGNSTSFSRNMEKGSQGNDVKELQKFLNTHGFTIASNGPGSAGNETELFGNATQAALIAFQKAQGINPALGYFGPLTKKTVEAMMSGGATTPVTPTQAQVQTDRDMEFGMSGDDVKKLQAFLVAQNTGVAAQALAKNGVSGYFGQLTKDAVIEFQKAKGISPAVGYVGSRTKGFIK